MTFSTAAEAERAFYDAFSKLDIDAMQHVWADSPDASCIHPGGGLVQGVEGVIDSWRSIFRDTSPPRVDYRIVQASADSRLAVHTVEEHVSSSDGQRHAVVLATNIYVNRDGSWRMLAHHASLPLVEREPTPPTPEASALH